MSDLRERVEAIVQHGFYTGKFGGGTVHEQECAVDGYMLALEEVARALLAPREEPGLREGQIETFLEAVDDFLKVTPLRIGRIARDNLIARSSGIRGALVARPVEAKAEVGETMPIEFFDEINRMLMDAEQFGALKDRAIALRRRSHRWYRPAPAVSTEGLIKKMTLSMVKALRDFDRKADWVEPAVEIIRRVADAALGEIAKEEA